METTREHYIRRKSADSAPKQLCLLAYSDYVVQFEEDQFQPGVWHDHSKFPGSVNSAVLQLSPYVNYQFRVIAVNEVGSSHPSLPSERYRTSGAREYLWADGKGSGTRHPKLKLRSPSPQPHKFGQLNVTSPRPGFLISETQNNKDTCRHRAIVRITLENTVWVLTMMPSV